MAVFRICLSVLAECLGALQDDGLLILVGEERWDGSGSGGLLEDVCNLTSPPPTLLKSLLDQAPHLTSPPSWSPPPLQEISKSNVVDDMVSSNSLLYKPGEHPDHVVVIK